MKGGVKHGLFLRIEEFARVHYWRVFLGTLLLVFGSIYLGSKLSLDGDVLSLLPRENRRINTFRQALRDFGGMDYLLVVAEAREGQGAEDLQEFADLLAARLQKIPSIGHVEHRIETSGPFFDFFRRNEILFLPPAKLPELAAKLTDDAIRQRVSDNARQLSGPSSILVKRVLQEDPFWISPLLLQEVLRNKGPMKVDLESGYYLSRDGQSLGPYTWESLTGFAANGQVAPDDVLWGPGLDRWTPAIAIPGLLPPVPAPPPRPTPPRPDDPPVRSQTHYKENGEHNERA